MVLRTNQALDPVFEAAESHLVGRFPVHLVLTLIDESPLLKDMSQPEQGLCPLYIQSVLLSDSLRQDIN